MNRNKQIKLTNSLVTLTGITLVIISLNKLLFQAQTSSLLKDSIGKISFYQNDIRLKRTDQFQWQNVIQQDLKVAPLDRVFSNLKSSAQVDLLGGAQISLMEQSLIRVKDQNTVKIAKGEALIKLTKTSRPLNVLVGGNKIQIKASENSEIQISHLQTPTLTLKSGKIEVSSLNETVNLAPNIPFNIENSKLKTVSLLYPQDEVLYTKSKTLDIKFRFEPKTFSKVEVSRDFDFKNISLKDANTLHKFSPGKYFWRIDNSEYSEFRVVRLLEPPRILSPQNNHEYVFYNETSSFPVEITKPEGLALISILSENNKFIQEVETKNKITEISNIESGRYKIQAKINNDFSLSDLSPPVNFSVKIDLDFSDFKIIELKKPNQWIYFEWEKKPGELSLFQVASDPQFKKIVSEKRIRSKNNTHLNFSKLGTYYWRAQKLTQNGELIVQKPIKILIRPTPPPAKPSPLPSLKIRLKEVKKSTFNFLYKIFNFLIPSAYANEDLGIAEITIPKIENAQQYIIEIFDQEKSATPLSRINVTTTTFEWSPPRTGKFYWRVKYIDYWKRESEFSEISQFSIQAQQMKKKKKKTISNNSHLKIKDLNKNSFIIEFLMGPSNLNFTQSLDEKIEIDGQVTESKRLKIEKEKSFSLEYETQGAKTFDEQSFEYRSLNLTSLKKYFYLSPSLNAKQIPIFTIEDDEVIFEESAFVYSAGLVFDYTHFVGTSAQLDLELSLYTLGLNQNQIRLSYQNNLNKLYKYKLQLSRTDSNYDHEDSSINIQYFQILAGLNRSF